jgi:uncharacterized membrane protein
MSQDPKSPRAIASKMGVITVLGAGIGTAVGAAIGNVAVGLAVGAALGVIIGAVMEYARRRQPPRS